MLSGFPVAIGHYGKIRLFRLTSENELYNFRILMIFYWVRFMISVIEVDRK